MLKNDIKFLGTSGSKKEDCGSTCVQVSDTIVIDAGNIIQGLKDNAKHIEHIFLTHSHLDHISDIAFLIDTYLEDRDTPLKIYGLKETINALTKHIFNWSIWPDFKEISLIKSDHKSIEFIEIEMGKEYRFDDVILRPIEMNHTVATCGYIVKKPEFSMIYATDTYLNDLIWEEANKNLDIKYIVIDVSFPSQMDALAKASKHLTPMLLKNELEKLERDDITIHVTHLKPHYKDLIERELEILNILLNNGKVLSDGDKLIGKSEATNDTSHVTQIALALSKEKDLNKILTLILSETMLFTNAEGGTIYLKEGDSLTFKAVKNSILDICEVDPDFPKIPLTPNGLKNNENISAVSALDKKTINIPDIYLYHVGKFNFDGTKKFDKFNDYKTKSMLVIPMINHNDEVIGVMQLINKKNIYKHIEFTQKDIAMASTYANLCASAIAKNQLIDDLEKLVISFLESISYALSVKSAFGYGHISRVKELMRNIAYEIHHDRTVFSDISYTKEEFQELELAAWMHDIGKIATPDHIIDKATRLETVYDRVEGIETRFNFVKQHLKAQFLESKCNFLNGDKSIDIDNIENRLHHTLAQLDDNLEFLKYANKAGTFMNDSDMDRVKEIAQLRFIIDDKEIFLLSEDESKNLQIQRGTLTDEERLKINEHAQTTYEMLQMITFPKKYSNVTKIASGHHEKLNGKGYPLGLKGDEISFETRMLAIVDILEALTASDRPYKKAKTKEQTFEILDYMVKDNELDKRLVAFIKSAKVFEKYIEQEQEEEVLML